MRNLFPYVVGVGLLAGCVTGSVNLRKENSAPVDPLGKCYESPKLNDDCQKPVAVKPEPLAGYSIEIIPPTPVSTPSTLESRPVVPVEIDHSKTQISIYFDPLCSHCETYLRMVDEADLEDRFSSEYQFHQVCVEIPFFGQDGRCIREQGQDGRKNFKDLDSRCRASTKDTSCGGVPTIFIGETYFPEHNWIKLQEKLERRH